MAGALLEQNIFFTHPDLLALESSSESDTEQKVPPFVFAIGGCALNETLEAIEGARLPRVNVMPYEPNPQGLARKTLALIHEFSTSPDEPQHALVVPLPELPDLIPSVSITWPADYCPNPSYNLIDPLAPLIDAAIDTSPTPGSLLRRYGLATAADPEQVVAALMSPEPLRYQQTEQEALQASFAHRVGMFTLTQSCIGNVYAFNNCAGAMHAEVTELRPGTRALRRVPFPATPTGTTMNVIRTRSGKSAFDISHQMTTSMTLAIDS